MLTLNGKRLLVCFGGDAWELEETNYDWHLIRHAVTVSMPKLITGWVGQAPVEENFAHFQARLSTMDRDREVKDGN